MNRPFTPPETTTGSHYQVTSSSLEDGRNKLGIEFTGPMDVPLCGFCDRAIPDDGYCSSCDLIHADCISLVEVTWLEDGRAVV